MGDSLRELPEFCYRNKALEVAGAVLHYYSARWQDPDNWADPLACWRQLVDLNRKQVDREWYLLGDSAPMVRQYASYHYMIDRSGEAYALVPLQYQTYHAGKSSMHGRQHCNQWTVGVAFIATHTSGFTDAQYETGARVCRGLQQAFGFSRGYIQGHDYVAPERKRDPGPRFEWGRFRTMLGEAS